jgi:hypothetical protein
VTGITTFPGQDPKTSKRVEYEMKANLSAVNGLSDSVRKCFAYGSSMVRWRADFLTRS